MNRCVCCGAVIPEGTMVCPSCLDKSLGLDVKTKPRWINIDDIRNEAVEEFVQTLKDRIRDVVMPKFECTDDPEYRIGADMCRLDIEIEIAKLLREFKEKEKQNG